MLGVMASDHEAGYGVVNSRCKNSIMTTIRQPIMPIPYDPKSSADLRSRRNLRPQSIVFGPHRVDAVDAFEPADREMTARDILEVLDEGEIDRRTADCTDDRHGLRRHFLRDDD